MVVIVEGNLKESSELSDEEIVQRLKFLLDKGVSKKAAIEIATDELKVGKNRVYKLAQNL